MKIRINPWRALGLAALVTYGGFSVSAAVPPWTVDLAGEFLIGADVNQDGRLDVVIVPQPTGIVQVGHQSASGQFDFVPPGPTGILPVTGVSVGRQLFPGGAGLAVTGPEANQLRLMPLNGVALGEGAITPYVDPLGPNQVVALPIAGPGATALDDLFVGTIWNSHDPYRFVRMRNLDGVMFHPLGVSTLAGRLERAQSIVLEPDGPPMVAGIVHGTTATFAVFQVDSDGMEPVIWEEGLPADVEFACGFFGGSEFSQVLFHRGNQPGFTIRPVVPGASDTLQLGEETGFSTATPVRQVLVLADESIWKLLLVFEDDQTAAVYDFDGADPPVLSQVLPLPDGFRLIGGVGVGLGVFLRIAPEGESGSGGTGGSDAEGAGHYAYYGWNGDEHVLSDHGRLGPALDSAGIGNVFEFRFEPFVHPQPRLLRVLKAGDWTSHLDIAAAPMTVVNERYGGSESGLGDPATVELGARHPQTLFGLPNQVRDDMSIFTFVPPMEDPVAQLSVFPPPGRYPQSVRVQIAGDRPNLQIRYRVNQDAWQIYTEPFVVFATATVQFYAQHTLSVARSTIRHARYDFDLPPDKLDSSGDGVPDFVKVALGLDPLSGNQDSDGDGFSDLEEILRGFDPLDPSNPVDLDNPQPGDPRPGFEQSAAFDLAITPLPWDGISNQSTAAAAGTLVQAHELTGAFLLSRPTEPDAAQPGFSSAWFDALPVQVEHPFLVISTEPHFDVVTAHPDTRIGRELIRIVEQPSIRPVIVNYEYGQAGGGLMAEASAWIDAARQAYLNAERQTFTGEIAVTDTLAALLLAHECSHILQQRGLEPEPWVTLTPFRLVDRGRLGLDADILALIESPFGNDPPYRVSSLFETIDGLLRNPGHQGIVALIELAHEIYRVSSALNNDAPGVYPSPVDVLRTYIEEGLLHPSYADATVLPDQVLNNAQLGLAYIRQQLGFRPLVTRTARIRFDTFTAPCRVLDALDGPDPTVALFDEAGRPFSFPDTFRMLPGTVLRVSGYEDLIVAGCSGQSMEVTRVELVSVPLAGPGDSDGNLLDDDWENQYPGLLGDPFADSDGDGYPDIQEMWEGTDPLNPNDFPNVPPVQVDWPLVQIEVQPDGEIELHWSWSEAYLDRIVFQVHTTTDLNGPLVPVEVDIIHLGDGELVAYLPQSSSDVQAEFFTISLALVP